MIIIGIDPGVSGGIAVLSPTETPFTLKLSETEHDIAAFLRGLRFNDNIFAYLEQVHAMPKQGVSSVFTFGQGYGFLRGCLSSHGIPFETVTPQRWQKAMGCLTKGDKNVSKARAQQLFPGIKCTHAISDALLIAEFGRRIRTGEMPAMVRRSA